MKHSYKLFSFHNIKIKIHLVYIFLIIIAPIVSYLIFNFLTALAITQFFILLNLSVLLHELGHAYIAKRYKSYFSEIILLPFGGISIRKNMPEDTFDELRIAVLSLGIKFIIVILMIPFIYYLYGLDNIMHTHIYDFSPILNFFLINLALLIFNIIPVYPLDGGRILRSYLANKYDYQRAIKTVTLLTYIIGAVLIIIGLIYGVVVIVLALFLYIGAQGKSRFDKAAEIISIGDEEVKLREREKYQAARKKVLERSKQVRARAEHILESMPVGILAKMWFKFQYHFDLKLTKGKFSRARDMFISLLPLISRIRNLLRLWLKTHRIRKSIFLMLAATFCLTVVWLLPFEFMLVFSAGFLICFCAGAFIIYYHTRSRRLAYYTTIGCFAWLTYLTLDLFEPLLKLDYMYYLFYEAFRGCMVPLSGIMFFAAIINSNDFFKAANAVMPLPMFVIIAALYIIGTIVLFYEIYLLSPYETSLYSIKFTLRHDIAYLIWFLASMLILASLIYLVYAGSISRFGRLTTFKLTVSTIMIILLFSFFSRDLIIITYGRLTVPPEDLDMEVGLNANNITMLDLSEFDKLFHLDVAYHRVYKQGPDEPDWSNMDWQLNYAIQNNISIYLLVNPQPPRWLANTYPESIMRDQWGKTFFWIDEDPQEPSTKRVWDLSFNDPQILNIKVNFTIEAVMRYQNLSCVRYISIQNEPTYPVDFNHLRLASYDPITITAFRNWLTNLFQNDLELLKNETRVEVEDWSEVSAPYNTTDRLWKQWLNFREDSLIFFVENLTDAVRNQTAKPVTVKIMGHFLTRYQTLQTGLNKRVLEQFVEMSDIVSLDLYPLMPSDLTHALEFYKDLAGKKRIIISEFNMALGTNLPGSGSMIYYNLLIINDYADAVFIYTGNDHYIYGINLYDHTPVHLGLKLYKLHREDGDMLSLYGELLIENFQSIPNYYEIYIYGCTVWNLPVIPWPIMLLLIFPVPIADDKKRWRIKKFMYAAIFTLLILFFITSNIY